MERRGSWTIQHRADVDVETVYVALAAPAETLKRSRKSLTRRMGAWVVKESRRGFVEAFKHTLRPGRYRQGWRAALHLARHGVPVPRPVAFAERRFGPIILGNVFICEYLDGWVNVEEYARRIVRDGAEEEAVRAFLSRLAGVVNSLSAANAYHSDLSGKNIFTRDGTAFRLIDLDGVVLGRPYTDERRLKNHVQLYDSFCDYWPDFVLGSFIRELSPEDVDFTEWFQRVRQAQAARRARTEAVWARQGRTPG
jgi:hypothetical protein